MAVIAALRIRGIRHLNPQARKTMELLRLNKPNHCVLVEDKKEVMGMLQKAKDYIAYGQVDEKTVISLLRKRGRNGSKRLAETEDEKKLGEFAKKIMQGAKVSEFANPVFRLRPPSKGFKDKKRPYPRGDLGKRDDMVSLLSKMI